jgi:hypothetical protein
MRYQLRRSRYRLYRKHRSAVELLLLKLMTDAALLGHSASLVVRATQSPSLRRIARNEVRCNLRIMGMWPLRW